MNDIFFCAEDILELLHQSLIRDAHITCGLDFMRDVRRTPHFYDTWVTRDALGHPPHPNGGLLRTTLQALFSDRWLGWEGWNAWITNDEKALRRLQALLPFPVQCCWNGAAVLHTLPFYSISNFTFRHGGDAPSFVDNSTMYSRCEGSECSVLCNDLQSHKFGRNVIVPRVKLAYDQETYRQMWHAETAYIREVIPDAISQHLLVEDAAFEWPEAPAHVYCEPMISKGQYAPDGKPFYEAQNG